MIRLIRPIRPIRPILFFLSAFLTALAGIFIYGYFYSNKAEASWWPEVGNNWAQRKQLTLTNNSGATLNSTAVVAVSIDTKALVDSNKLRSDCSDLRILYQPTSSTATELTRHLVYTGGTTCSTSTTTKVNFNLQANITNGSSDTNYYLYYSNPHASTPTSTDNAFDISSADALLVCPFDGSTTCAAGETPSTSTGALRYSGAKLALSFDGVNDNVSTAANSSFDPGTGDYTLEAWVKPFTLTSNQTGIVKYQGTPHLTLELSNNALLFEYDDGPCTGSFGTSTGTLTANTWSHVAVTIDRDVGATFYINGAQSGTVAGVTSCQANITGGTVTVGAHSTYFPGLIDEVRVSNSVRYTAAFTPQTTPFIKDSNTLMLFHFDENGSDSRNAGKAIDDSGNGNHGTITGAKYVGGLVGVDSSTSDTGYQQSQSYAGHNGIFIEEGTTNKITNPSFDNSTYDTNWDGVGGNLTVTENTSAPYYKFGSKSAKIVAAGAISGSSNMDTIGIDPDSTATHTLSAYVYNGTTVGGTVDGTVAKLVFEGAAQTTTYTDMGGGWWRLSYSAATTDSTNEYGIEVADTKTIYIDGVQLEAKAYATTYTDGTLGTGYAWTSTAHNSTSTRTQGRLRYSTTDNLSATSGTITGWVKPPTGQTWAQLNNLKILSFGNGRAYVFYAQGWGGISFSAYDGADWNNNPTVSYTPSANTWFFIAARWNSTQYKMCVNTSCTTSNDPANYPQLAGTDLTIGDYNDYGTTGNSTYSDLRVFNSDLTDSQLADLYYSGLLSHSQGTVLDRFSNNKGEDPAGVWHFDEGQGTSAHDSSVNKNTGTISGATWVTEDQCVAGKCLKFDGTDDTVSWGDVLDIGTNDQTASFWLHTADSTNNAILGKRDSSVATNKGWLVAINNGLIYAQIADGTASRISLNSTINVADNKWHYVNVVWDRDGNISIYIDGKADISTSISSQQGDASNAVNLYVGNDAALNAATYFPGFIDEVKIYPYTRSAAQVEADYNSRGGVNGASAVLGMQQSEALSDGLVGYWKMDEAAANSCTGGVNDSCDSSGNNNNGAWNGDATTTAGKFGNGVTFDGTGDYIEIADSSSLSSGYKSVSVWVYRSVDTGTYELIYSDWKDDGVNKRSFNFYISNTDKATCEISNNGGSGPGVSYNGALTSITTVSTGSWYHLACSYDGQIGKIYVNGLLEDSETSVSGTLYDSDAVKRIGSNNVASPTYFLNAKLDDLRIYNRALSPKEVSDLYNWAPGPVLHLNMDQKVKGDSKTLTDSSGLGNNGTTVDGANNTGMDCSNKPGKYGGGCEFDGTDDYVSMSDNSSLNSNTMTIEGWVYPKSFIAGAPIYNRRAAGNIGGVTMEYSDTTGKISCYFYISGSWRVANTSSSLTLNQWNHVTCTYDGSTIRPYINSIADATTTSISGNINNPTSPSIEIGRNIADNNKLWNGLIDDVKIYNYARSQKQIIEDFSGQSSAVSTGGRPSSPVAYYSFDEGYGQTANNKGNGGTTLNGTLGATSGSSTDDPSWSQAGKFNKALSFDGGDYINMGAQSPLQITGDVAFGGWINITSAINQAGIISTGLSASEAQAANINYQIWLNTASGNDIEYLHEYSTGTNHQNVFDTNLSIGTWYHVFLVRNTTDKTVKLYLNGKQQGSTYTYTNNPDGGTSSQLNIGRDINTSTYFNGSIDEVKVYNYALTSEEIRADYNKGSSQILGALSDNSSYQKQAANQEYCIPGDSTSCAAPVARWDFEEGKGGTVNDTSGNNNVGTWYGTDTKHWTPGKSGWGGNFNGSDDYVGSTNNTGISGNTAFTIEGWIKTTTTGAIECAMGTGDANTSLSAAYLCLNVIGTGAGSLGAGAVSLEFAGGNGARSGAGIIQANTWYHIAAVKTTGAINTTTSIFVNGVLQTISTSSTGTPNITNATANIGRYGNNNSLYFSGSIDQVRIFNYARTPAQVAWDYNKGAPVGHWRMDECSGINIKDSSPNKNTGTLTLGSLGQTSAGTCSESGSTAWYSGRVGKRNYSLNFDGQDDYISTTIPTINDYNGNFSVAGWFKTNSLPNAWQAIIAHEVNNAIGNRQFSIDISPSGSGFLCGSNSNLSFFVQNSTADSATCTNYAIQSGQWYHFVATYNGSKIYLYVNGQLASSANQTSINSVTADTFIGILDQNGTKSVPFSGQIDDVRIYNYALTGTQVKDIYNDGAINFGPGSGAP